MFRILLTGTVVIVILGGLFYWRFSSAAPKTSKNPTINNSTQSDSLLSGPKEVPAEPPIISDANTLSDLQSQIDSLKKQVDELKKSEDYDLRIKVLETAIADIRAQVVKLSSSSTSSTTTSTTTTSSTSSKSPLYIPLGSGGGPWGNKGYYQLDDYQVNIDPGNYSGYKSMQLEVIYRLAENSGTGYVNLYNATDSSTVSSSEVSLTGTNFLLKTSGTFTLSGGSKNYKLQIKSSEGSNLFIQTARIKVNF